MSSRTTACGPLPVRSSADGDRDEPPLGERLAGLSWEEAGRLLEELVATHVAAVLGHDGPEAVAPGRGFLELGLDSLAALELRNRLSGATGERLPATLIYDCPTTVAVAEFLRTELVGEPPAVGDGADLAALDAELSRIEQTLFAVARPGDAEAARIGVRLRSLATKWAEAHRPAGADLAEAEDLAGASADELFRMLDGELET